MNQVGKPQNTGVHYTAARHIYYNFKVKEFCITTAAVRSALVIVRRRDGRSKLFKTKKVPGGIKIWRES